MNRQTKIFVSCALIESGSKLLAARRGPGMKYQGFWEFPGGKIEYGESAEEAIIREIHEELLLEIEIIAAMNYVDKEINDLKIRLFPFRCRILRGKPQIQEHSEIRWLDKEASSGLNWLDGDRKILENWLLLKANTHGPS